MYNYVYKSCQRSAGLRLFDPASKNAQAATQAWLSTAAGAEGGALPAAFALAADGARLLARAWRELRLPQPDAPAADCAVPRASLYAETLVNHMRTVTSHTYFYAYVLID